MSRRSVRSKLSPQRCHLLAVLSLLCIVWITVFPVEIAARRRLRLPSGVSFFCKKFYVSLVDLAKPRRQRRLEILQLHNSLNSHDQLQQSHAQLATAASHVRVISWDPSRPWRGPTRQPTQSAAMLYSQGQLWGPNHLSMGVWGWGQQPAHQLIVRVASQRLRLIQAQRHGILAPGASVYRPRLLPLPGSDQTSAQVLQELESRWTASLQTSPSGRDRLGSDSQPAWMAPSRGLRQHWSERQQQQQAQQQQPAQQPRQLPSDRAANNDTMDVLGDPGDPPQLAEWRRLWQLASAAYLNRQHRVLWWRILHGCVMCGAFSAYIGRATPQQACCPFASCRTPTQPQAISHVFLDCPVAATVINWLCRLWQTMTGHTPDALVATILAASTPAGQCFFGWESYSLHL